MILMAAEDQFEGNQYAGYLDDSSRPMTRFLKDEEDENSLLHILNKQALHIGVTLGVAAIAHRTGAVNRVARFLNTEGKASLQAFKETWHHNGKLKQSSLSELFREFNERRRTNVEARKEELKDFMRARETGLDHEYDIERVIRQINHTIDKKVPDTIENAIRFNRIMHDLEHVHQLDAHHIEHVYRALEQGAVRNKDLGFLRYMKNEEFNAMMRQHGVNSPEVLDALNTARERHQNIMRNQAEDIQRIIEARQEQLRDFTTKHINGIVKGRWDQRFRNAIAGHRLATVNDIMTMHHNGQIKLDEDLRAQIQHILDKNQKFGETIFDRNLQVKDIHDYKVFEQGKRKAMNWLASTIPGGLAHLRDILNIEEARRTASIVIVNRGARFQSLNAQMGVDIKDTLHDEIMFFNGKFVKVNPESLQDPGAVEILNKYRDMYLTSSSFGTIANNLRRIGGIMSEEKKRNPVTQVLDLFNQDKDSGFGLNFSLFSKFFNKDWERKIITDALKNGVDYDQYHDVRRYFEKYTKGLSARTLNKIIDSDVLPARVKEFIENNQLNFSKDEDMIKLFRYFGEDEEGSQYASNQLKALWKRYERDPDSFLASKKPIGESNLFIGEYTNIQTGMDRIKQSLGLEMIHQIQDIKVNELYGSGITFNFREFIDNLERTGKILSEDRKDAQFLYSFYEFQRAGQSIYTVSETTLTHVNDLFTGTDETSQLFQQNLKENVKRTNPFYERFTGTRPLNQVGNDYIAVNKAWSGWNGWDTIKDLGKQLSLTTGRRNMEDVTTLSIFGAYYPFYRLQDALGSVKLGFSDDSMGSPLQLMSSLFLKRMLPIYAGVQAYQYLDYRLDQDTGAGLTERYQKNVAMDDLEDAWKQDKAGITERKKRDYMLHPGIDQWGDMPSLHIPGIGQFGPGKLLGILFAPGTPIDEKDTYTYEEMQDYYNNGVDPIRKSKWWLMGSKSAYRGERITEFRPNPLRMAESDWEYSNVTATGQERWEHSYFPTFENWFGLKHLLGMEDPYWFERKHYYDRPYLLTGSMFNPNTMWLGDIGNATIGQLIKPVRQMHPEYWGDPVLVTEDNNALGERPNGPITTRISPAGRMENVVKAGTEDYGANSDQGVKIRYIRRPQLDEKGNETGAYVVTDLNSKETIFVPASLADRSTNDLYEMAIQPAADEENTKPRAMFSQDYPYQQEVANRRLRNMKDPRSLEWRSQEAFENFREMLGAYNWIVGDELIGYNPYTNKTRIQSADAATNFSNQFWNANLGSLGGELSEIGRRFVRRDSGQLEDYNPVRNTMPDWLPGSDYIVNFLEGDAYEKIPNGVYRLPGEAYEKLNKLHPDSTGEYGAFDKFKILADVAPWSDEY